MPPTAAAPSRAHRGPLTFDEHVAAALALVADPHTNKVVFPRIPPLPPGYRPAHPSPISPALAATEEAAR